MRLLVFLIAGLFLASTATAMHRQPEVFTTVAHVLVNGQPMTQVTHRVHAHDAISVLGRLEGVTRPNLDDQNLARLALYVHQRFSVEGAALTPLGGEVEGHHVYFYEERTGHAVPLRSVILRDLDEGWSNHITIEGPNGERASLLFTEDYIHGFQKQP